MQRSLLILLPAALLALAGCKKPPPANDEQAQARSVRVVRVEARSLVGGSSASGDLVPREEAAVLPAASGYRVARVLVDAGSYVRKGQPLVELDPTLVQAQLSQAQSLAAQAEAQARQAEDEAERVRGLDGQGVLSQEQINQRRFQAKAARANANVQAAALKDSRSRLTVAAPVSGLVLERNVRPGDLSAAGAAPWFRIARDGQIELQAQVSDEALAHLKPGQRASVDLPGGVVANGTIRLVSPQIDPQTKLGFVRVQLPVRGDIRAGGFGRAVFVDVSASVPTAPETAIRYDADGAGVMVVDAKNRVHREAVQTGRRGAGGVELLKGPPVGSLIVQNAAAFLLDGDLVRPIMAQPQTQAQQRSTPSASGGVRR